MIRSSLTHRDVHRLEILRLERNKATNTKTTLRSDGPPQKHRDWDWVSVSWFKSALLDFM
jgi:hypothetical protein